MAAIQAVFENGMFRPIGPVDLPEGTVVFIDPAAGASANNVDSVAEARRGVYEVLTRRYKGGGHDDAERHNEHQP